MLPLAPTPTPTPSGDIFKSPDVTQICPNDALCSRVFDWTGNQWLANSSYVVIVKPLRVLGIILAAMLIRWLIHRAIRRLTDRTATGSMPTILRPWRNRASSGSTPSAKPAG